MAELVRFIESSVGLSRPGPKARGTRPLIVLFGDHAARPDGLERDLLRAGFQVAEADDIEHLPGRPALVVATCVTLSGDRAPLNEAFTSARATGAQVVVLIADGESEDLIRAAELGVAVEHNAAPERLDLSDRDLRLAKELGCKIVINTDAHNLRDFDKMTYGLRQLRRAWLGPEDVLNTKGPAGFLAALRPRP